MCGNVLPPPRHHFLTNYHTLILALIQDRHNSAVKCQTTQKICTISILRRDHKRLCRPRASQGAAGQAPSYTEKQQLDTHHVRYHTARTLPPSSSKNDICTFIHIPDPLLLLLLLLLSQWQPQLLRRLTTGVKLGVPL
jgi:hypothetical protein